MKFWIKQGDRSPNLVATLTDDTGAAVDTTGWTSVVFRMLDRETNTLVVSDAPASFLVPRTDGKVQYSWDADDTQLDGTFLGEFEVTKSAGVTQTYPGDEQIEIEISPSLDGMVSAPVTAADMYNLRRMTGEVGDTMFGDKDFANAIVARDFDMDAAAYDIWTWKAAEYANLVTVKEGGSDRLLSDLLKNAQQMISFYAGRSATIIAETTFQADVKRPARTRAIVRE